MYDDFLTKDRWTKQPIRCLYQALIVAIATRHADAVDVKFPCGDRPIWIALPATLWVEYERESGRKISDPLAVQVAGHFLKYAIESGLHTPSESGGRAMYSLTKEQAMEHLRAVLREHGEPSPEPITPWPAAKD